MHTYITHDINAHVNDHQTCVQSKSDRAVSIAFYFYFLLSSDAISLRESVLYNC